MSTISFADSHRDLGKRTRTPTDESTAFNYTQPERSPTSTSIAYDPNISRIKAANSGLSPKKLLAPIQTRPTETLRPAPSPRKSSAGSDKSPTGLRVLTRGGTLLRELPLRKTSRDSPSSLREDTGASNGAGPPAFGGAVHRVDSDGPTSPGSFVEAPQYVHTGRSGPLQTLHADDIIRPSVAREHTISDFSQLPPTPRLRTSGTVPEHRFLRYAHPQSSRGPRSRDPRFYDSPAASPAPPISTTPVTSPLLEVAGAESESPVRESAKSAPTQMSSPVDLSSTERSSISTNMTSASELLTPNTPWSIKPKEEELTVEDCIALYAEGFHDDPPEIKIPPAPANKPPFTYPKRKSSIPSVPLLDIPAAEKSLLPAPAEEPSSGRITSAQILAGDLTPAATANEAQPSEPEPDPHTDRYGFKKYSPYVSLEEHETWNAEYQQYLDRRRQKWNDLMRQYKLSTGDTATEFPPKNDRVKRFIRKGIPPEWRGAAWFWYAGGPARIAQNRGLYDHLIARTGRKGQLGEGDREHIERDLHRTFPDNHHFKRTTQSVTATSSRQGSVANSIASSAVGSDSAERPIITSLRRVLQAFAIHQPSIGYCQSLNFLAGHLLLFLHGDEEKAFHLLCILTSEHLPNTHSLNLDGANADINVLMQYLKDSMPALYARLDDHTSTDSPTTIPHIVDDARSRTRSNSVRSQRAALPTVSLATTPWLMSAFVSTLPPESCARAWDVLFAEGPKTLFRICLGIFRLGEAEIRAIPANDPAEVFQVVQGLPRKMIDANALMESSFGEGLMGRGLISGGTVGKRRKEEMRGIDGLERAREAERNRAASFGDRQATVGSPGSSGAGSEAELARRPLSRGASMKGLASLARLKSMRRGKAPPVPAYAAS